tara:strand:- start:86137 stop:86532 length:396 start_codon:yes stop_codon:yes gene_type:complete
MILKIAILIYLSVMFIIESFHDYNVWKSSSNSNYEYTKKWHTYDFIFQALMGILISYLVAGITWEALHLLVNIGILRFVILNTTLNKLRGKKWHYLSKDSNFIDKLLKKEEKAITILIILIGITSWAFYII